MALPLRHSRSSEKRGNAVSRSVVKYVFTPPFAVSQPDVGDLDGGIARPRATLYSTRQYNTSSCQLLQSHLASVALSDCIGCQEASHAASAHGRTRAQKEVRADIGTAALPIG